VIKMAWASKFNKLSGTSADLDLGASEALPARKFGELIYHSLKTGDDKRHILTMNNDSNSDYSSRHSLDGGVDSTGTSQPYMDTQYTGDSNKLHIWSFINIGAEEKLFIGHIVESDADGAGTAPHRIERVHKYTDTATGQITRIDSSKGVGADYKVDDLATVILTDD